MAKKPWTPYTDYNKRKETEQKAKVTEAKQIEKTRKTICEGIEIQPISKSELDKKLAQQKAQGYGIGLSGVNTIEETTSTSKVIKFDPKKKEKPSNRLIAQIESKYGKLDTTE